MKLGFGFVVAILAILLCFVDVNKSSAQDCRGTAIRSVVRAPFAIAGRSRGVIKNLLGRTINGTRNVIRVRSWGCNGGQAVSSYGCNGSGNVASAIIGSPSCSIPVIQSNCPGGICPVPDQSQWTWPGGTARSLQAHLQSDPHEHSAAELSGLSFQQMQNLHSAEHDLHRHITGAGPSYTPGISELFQGRIALNTQKPVESDWF